MDKEAKYVVLKQIDLPQIRDGLWDMVLEDIQPLDDAVVIRMKDPFAATALYTYANTILSVLELVGGDVEDDDYKRMMDIADYFHERANESRTIINKRLPD